MGGRSSDADQMIVESSSKTKPRNLFFHAHATMDLATHVVVTNRRSMDGEVMRGGCSKRPRLRNRCGRSRHKRDAEQRRWQSDHLTRLHPGDRPLSLFEPSQRPTTLISGFCGKDLEVDLPPEQPLAFDVLPVLAHIHVTKFHRFDPL